MARQFLLVAVLMAVAATLAIAEPALAGPPGKWSRVTGIDGVAASNTDEIGLERTADGVLHVAWTRPAGGLADTLLQSAISANAKAITGPVTILGPPNNGLNNSVDLLAGPGGGLRVLFAGLFPASGIDRVMSTATASAAGAPWSAAQPASSTGSPSPVYVAAGIGGAVSPASTVVSTWGDSGPGDGGYHLGLSPAGPDAPFSPSVSEVDPNVAFDSASGAGFVAWNVLDGGGPESVKVLPLAGGGKMTAPKSGAAWIGQRVSISGRIGGGGVFVAYGSGSNEFSAKPAWWRVGAAKATVIGGQKDAEQTGLAAAPGGRLWLYWARSRKVYAARTNKSTKKLGAIVSLKAPKGTSAIYELNGEASRGPLDLLALAEAKGGLGYFHQRILPGLTLTAKPKAVGRGGKVTFRATDAGAPAKGAKVTFKLGKKKQSKKTDAKGKATIKVPAKTKPGKYAATARKAGYSQAKQKVRIKR